MITLDLTGDDSILVEEKSEKVDDVLPVQKEMFFQRYDLMLQMVYHTPEKNR